MQIGMIGLGRMGGNMARRLIRAGHEVVAFHRDASQAKTFASSAGATPVSNFADLARALKPPRAVWIMVPAEVVDSVIEEVTPHLEKGDIVIDGGNSRYTDDARRAAALAPKGLEYVDVGTSGGVWGLERGYCLMIGGTPPRARPAARAISHRRKKAICTAAATAPATS